MNKSRDTKPAATDEDKVAFTPEVPAGAELSKPIIETPAGLSDGDEKIRIFEMKISRAGYVPNNFTINAGDTIQIRMTALDNDYDFYLPWHGIYQNILRGEMKLISFTPKEGGTLAFECRDKCPGGKITGSIVVLP
jgi:heme/copper-type cytochrome/quinol oxidase subunit 2